MSVKRSFSRDDSPHDARPRRWNATPRVGTAEPIVDERPTPTSYASLDAAYEHFNQTLFAGELPPCLITVARHSAAYGYFGQRRFVSVEHGETTDEIALNPTHFAHRPPADTLSSLVHEMVHLWQSHFGKPSRAGYHNREWAAKMIEVGLEPTDTGEPGGKQTGQRMTHLVVRGGAFARECHAFLKDNRAVLFHDQGDAADSQIRATKAASKTKYTCPGCCLNAWAKPNVLLVCGECDVPLDPNGEDD